MQSASFRRDRKSAVAVLFAIMAVPILALIGLAIDDGIWNQTYASMSVAASGAALNAVKIAAHAYFNNEGDYIQKGTNAGQAWFAAETAGHAGGLTGSQLTINIQTGATVTATVTYSGHVTSILGHDLFGDANYPINLSAAAAIPTSPYLNVEIMLDNSPSMEIGATPNDIYAMQMLTPCSTEGAVYNLLQNMPPNGTTISASGQYYSDYQCTGADGKYDGPFVCPIAPNTRNYPYWPTSVANGQPGGNAGGQVCANLPPQRAPSVAAGQPPLAGAPCAFACHFDTGKPAGTGADYYRLARDTIVSPHNAANLCSSYKPGPAPAGCQITLRFDLVKQAVNQVLSTMQADNVPIDNGDGTLGNLNVGVFTFDAGLSQVYPAAGGCGLQPNSLSCQAGNDWAVANALVGQPPTQKDTQDNGIKPYGGGNVASTNFTSAMQTLMGSNLTAAGNGSSDKAPSKVLFLVTDGLADFQNGATRVNQGFDYTLCEKLKAPVNQGGFGYKLYVVYTPYYPLMNAYYLDHTLPIAEGSGEGTILYNLRSCATDPVNDFIQANPSDTASIANALHKFLIDALNTPARFTE